MGRSYIAIAPYIISRPQILHGFYHHRVCKLTNFTANTVCQKTFDKHKTAPFTRVSTGFFHCFHHSKQIHVMTI